MHVIDAAAVHDALPFERLVPALRRMFARGCTVPPRHVHDTGAFTSLIMPAWTERHYGVKTINVAPANAARGLPALHASYALYDAATGALLALIDGDALTARRTAAVSALAASLLVRGDASHLLVVGAGRVAALLAPAYRAVLPVARVTVWSRTAAHAERLAADWRCAGIDATAGSDLEAAARSADIVSCATLATAPLVRGAWLRPGSHLDLIGSYTPAMRECDDAAVAGAAIWVDTDEALHKSGDLAGPLERGVVTAAAWRGTLAQLARGDAAAGDDPAERTLFKSVGTALADLAAAVAVLDAVNR